MTTGEMVRVTTEDGHVTRIALTEAVLQNAISEEEVEALRGGDSVVLANGWRVEMAEALS